MQKKQQTNTTVVRRGREKYCTTRSNSHST